MTLRLLPALAGITYPVIKTPNWSTDVQVSVSGKRTTLQRWSYPIYSFEVGYEFLRTDTAYKEYQELVAFYNLAGGRAQLWRFNDPDDGTATNQPFGVGDGTTLTFQLTRAMQGSTLSWVDPVYYPTGTPQIFIDGALQDPSSYSISQTGLVTFGFAPGPASVLTWTGTFDWLVRFDEDSSSFEKFTYNLFELKKLTFSTEKL